MVPIPGTLEENIDAAFAQEICKGLVLLSKSLKLARRNEGTGPRHLRCPPQGPHKMCDAMEDRVRPVLKLGFV